MKIALHRAVDTFFEPWKAYCEKNNIPHKVVNCYDNDIVDQLADCDIVMWHHNHADPRDVLFARQLLVSLEISGKTVFPDHYSTWHFDDKLGQKYLFEATGVPHVPTHVFYTKPDAVRWLEQATLPKVLKLRRGAGSRNVWLAHTKAEAMKAVNKAFGKGFRQYDAIGGVKESLRKARMGKAGVKDIAKAAAHIVYPLHLEKSQGREKGYIYFQDFIPQNKFDIRVIIIGDRAFAIKRHVRENDFRASGSGFIEYDRELFDESLIALSFSNADKIKAYCAAFDYVFLDGKPLVVEVSYGFNKKGYYDCPGYWSRNLTWNEGKFDPYGWMIDDLIKRCQKNG